MHVRQILKIIEKRYYCLIAVALPSALDEVVPVRQRGRVIRFSRIRTFR